MEFRAYMFEMIIVQTAEMESLEKHPDFNPVIKLRDTESDKQQTQSGSPIAEQTTKSHDVSADRSHDQDEEDGDMGFSLFQQAEEEPKGFFIDRSFYDKLNFLIILIFLSLTTRIHEAKYF